MTKNEIVVLYEVLSTAKMDDMAGRDKLSVIKLLLAMKPIVEKFKSDRNEVRTRMLPDNWQEISDKGNEWRKENDSELLTQEEAEYLVPLHQYLKDELMSEVEVELPLLEADVVAALLEHSEWAMDVQMLMVEKLIKTIE